MKDLSSLVNFHPQSQKKDHPHQQFDQFEATTLFCPKCNQAVPVRKKLLLALPDGDKYDYLCVHCGNSVGTKTERSEMPVQLIIK